MVNEKFLGLFPLILFIGYLIFIVTNYTFGVTCHMDSIGEDKYCYNNVQCWSNTTNSCENNWEVRSHEQDRLNEIAKQERLEKERLANEESKRCYDVGKDYNFSFDIQKDYGYSCKQLEYLNDHLIDNYEKKDAGYIRGSYSGFLSSGYVSGEMYQYINQRIIATGELIENITYHLDCNNQTHNEKINYYTEQEFVMYYVEECLE